jgi:ABC-type Fe3+-hydroxamate transport system substrate-binding protein
MRIVSLVPSWTETLIKADLLVVGRTRYCIHPAQKVTNIPIVGGTKEVDWALIAELKPDIVIMDKEENPLALAEECPLPYLATHVASLLDMQRELDRLGKHFKNLKLQTWASETEIFLKKPKLDWNFKKIPGIIELVRPTDSQTKSVIYVIWKKPWMSVNHNTFIGSVLSQLGAKLVVFEDEQKYPVIFPEEFKQSFFLFSSEPYPFHKKIAELRELSYSGAVIDGEAYSWFGIRNLEFLKSLSPN